MPDDNLTPDTLSQTETNVPAGDGKEAASEAAVSDTQVLAKIKAATGKDFKSLDAAVKSFADTLSFVGKKTETKPEAPAIDTSKFVSKDEFDKSLFLAEHKDLSEPLKEVLTTMAAAKKATLSDTFKSEAFQKVYSAVSAQDEASNAKTVLESNSRLGVAKDKMAQAFEASARGDLRNAQAAAVDAVVDLIKV